MKHKELNLQKKSDLKFAREDKIVPILEIVLFRKKCIKK